MADNEHTDDAPFSAEQARGHIKTLRHNVNNSLLFITSAAELIKLKPESAVRYADQILEQQDSIVKEFREFGEKMEKNLGISDV